MIKLKTWIKENLINSRGRINTRKFKKIINDKHCQKIINLTSHLKESVNPSERIYCVLNSIIAYRKCKICDNNVFSFIDSSKGYREYCSVKCMNYDPDIIDKFHATNLKKYGVNHPCKLKKIIENRKKTCLKKYGFQNAMQCKDVVNNLRKAMISKYGVDNSFKLESTRNKFKKTCMKKYGTEYPAQSHISQETYNLLNDKNWLIEKNHIDKKSCYDISQELGISETLVYKKFTEHKLELKNFHTSSYESDIIKFLDEQNISIRSRKIISPYEIDIYLPDIKLGIEFNGLFWHSSYSKESDKKTKNRHISKTEMCKEKDIQLLHIFENEWVDPIKKEIWKSMINSKLGRNDRIFARKCEVKEITDNRLIRQFLNDNHLQGFAGSSIKLGLFYEEELVSLMTFGKARYSKKCQYEMIRFCNNKNINIVGGASKLFKHFIGNYDPKSILSYADRRHSNGKLYEILGFEHSHNSKPNYFYFINNKMTLYPRIKFQKHKLEKQLEVFNKDISETENMFINNYRRIWDCGNMIFEWRKI